VDARRRILVVDDDARLAASLRRALAYEGHAVEVAPDGPAALVAARDRPPDLVVLDGMLPGLDGVEVCRRLREGSDVPILMLTARDTVSDRVGGLDAGADDYLVKPFAYDELLARVRALLRRREPRGRELLRCADLVMDVSAHEVRRGDRAVEQASKIRNSADSARSARQPPTAVPLAPAGPPSASSTPPAGKK